MKLKGLSDSQLLAKMKCLVSEERKLTLDILHHLREVERRRLFAVRGFSSLFEYCEQELGYSGGSAQRRIEAMRLLRELPEIEKQIETGALNLSLVSQAARFFRHEEIRAPETKREVVEALVGMSTRQAERELVSRSSEPETLVPERVRPISPSHSELKLVVDEAILAQLEELRNLLAHQIPGASLSDLFRYGLALALKKHRPRSPNPLPAPEVKVDLKRRPTSEVKRQVWQRDGGACTYTDAVTGRRCDSRHALELDHIRPFSLGGETSVAHLRLRCRAHNQLAAIRELGVERMAMYLPGLR